MNDKEIVEKVMREQFDWWYPAYSQLLSKEKYYKKFEKRNKFIREIVKSTIAKKTNTIFGFEDSWQYNETYKKVLKHRKDCTKWGKEFCLDCFGGGLTKFTENIRQELRKKWCEE